MRLICSIATVILAQFSPNLAAQETVISNVTLISPERFKPLYNAHVKIVDNQIIEVSSSQLTVNPDTIKVDGKGKYLIPGLMDSHVHVSSMPGAMFEDGATAKSMSKLQQQFFTQQPRSYLYFGVTQILDPSQSKIAIEKFNGYEVKPDLFHCGAVPIIGGYPTLWTNNEVMHSTFSYLLDPKRPEHTAQAVVDRMAKDGAHCVKVFIEDGFGTNSDWPLVSQQQLKQIQKAAKKHNLPVLAHANAIDMQKISVDAKVDVMAHGMWNWNHLEGQPGLPNEIKAILDKVIDENIVYQATFNVMDGLKGVTTPGVLNNPLYNKAIPQDIIDWYHTEDGQWFKREMLKDFGGGSLESVHRRQDMIISQGERVLQYLYSQGQTMVLASDTPSSPTYAAQPGFSTFTELKHMAKIGISLADILAAATINNAKSFGLDERYGTVEPGKIANLLLLEQNPLSTVEAYNSIEKVILHGQVIERETLSANQ